MTSVSIFWWHDQLQVASNSLNRDRTKIQVEALSRIYKSDAAYEEEYHSSHFSYCTEK
jgi:hypothetical protein